MAMGLSTTHGKDGFYKKMFEVTKVGILGTEKHILCHLINKHHILEKINYFGI